MRRRGTEQSHLLAPAHACHPCSYCALQATGTDCYGRNSNSLPVWQRQDPSRRQKDPKTTDSCLFLDTDKPEAVGAPLSGPTSLL